MRERPNGGNRTLDSPLEDDISLDHHLQLVGHNLTVGIVLIFTVETEGGRKRFQLADVIPEQRISEGKRDRVCCNSPLYLRICSSNWIVLWVSFNRGTVKRRPAHTCSSRNIWSSAGLHMEVGDTEVELKGLGVRLGY